MTPPRRLKVGPYVYTVTLDAGLQDGGLRGSSDTDLLTIRLNPANPPSVQRTTLLHECLHAVATAAGIRTAGKLSEEEWVTRMEPGLTALLRDNRQLVAFLTA